MITIDPFVLLTPQQCAATIAAGMASSNLRRGHMKDWEGKNYFAPAVRQSSIAFLQPDELGEVAEILRERGEQLNRDVFKADLSGVVQFQFAAYEGAKGEFIEWHEDEPLWDGRWRGKKISMCTQLSEPAAYEGGVLEIEGRPPTPRGVGVTVAFPAFMRHRVTPVTSGWRFSIVTWFHGPHWR